MPGRRRRDEEEEEEEEENEGEDDEDDEEEEEEEEDAAFDEDAARKAAKRMTVTALREALEELGEEPEGSKAQLVEQLVAAQAAAAVEADVGNDEEEGEEEEDQAVEDMDDRALLEEAVTRARRLEKQQKTGSHEIICVLASTCGYCETVVKGTQYYDKVCRVRICRLPGCIQAHMNGDSPKRTTNTYKEVEKVVVKNPRKSHPRPPAARQ